MKAPLSFGISVIISFIYLIIFKSLTPLPDIILSTFIIFLIGFIYTKTTTKKNPYIKMGLLVLIISIIVLPKIFLSPEAGLFDKAIWTFITFAILKKEIEKGIKGIKKRHLKMKEIH